MAVDNKGEKFDEVFKKFDEIQFSRRTIEELSLHTIPSGSQEFQKVLWACDDSDKNKTDITEHNQDSDTFRQRSHTIDSSYTKHKKHHVHFPSTLETKPGRCGSSESVDGTRHGILIRHHADEGRERSNTIDSDYRKHRKFVTIPQSSRNHHSSSDSIGEAEGEEGTRGSNKSKVQCSKHKNSHTGDKRGHEGIQGSSHSPKHKGSINGPQRKTSTGSPSRNHGHSGSPHGKHSHNDHHVH